MENLANSRPILTSKTQGNKRVICQGFVHKFESHQGHFKDDDPIFFPKRQVMLVENLNPALGFHDT